jgi:WD40 repeat protein
MPKALFLSFFLLFELIGLLPGATSAQECSPPPITPNSKYYNIFSPEQEMVLGELTYQKMSGDMRFVKDPELVAYLNRMGEKLIKHLPPTGLKFQFFIVDIPEANAFDVPGGYIFVSRKLIGFANNEDELAGVIAHELGHAVVRHVAIDFSERLKKVLNVTQVGDRKDVTDKYNLLIERQRTKPAEHRSGEGSHQLEADQIGLFAMVAAGYDPNAFAALFDRLVETKGKTGNWFTDLFGTAKPEQKRLREMIKISEQLPSQCREIRRAVASGEFLKWQADVVSYHDTRTHEELQALLWKKPLSPKLRSDITHFAFSTDGRYFLAQDDFAITVVQREPTAVMMQIPAPDADDASFTPDGKFVVFGTESLRHEKWGLAEKKPVQIREFVVRRDCWEHAFSPDGNFLVCVDYGLNLNVLDTQTGRKLFEKKDFYHLSFFEYLNWILAERLGDDTSRIRFFNIEFSPDSSIVAVARSNNFRFSFRSAFYADKTEDTLLALELASMKTLKTGGDLKTVTRRSFIFLDSNRILGMASDKIDDSGYFSFPEGKRLARFPFGGNELKRTANPNYIIVKPLEKAKMGVFDVSRNVIVTASDKVDADLWGNFLVYESVSGKVLLSDFRYDEAKKTLESKPLTTIDIPVAEVGELYAADLSSNLQWLAISTKTRGALWNVSSGERKLFVRGFRGALLADDGAGIGEFPKQDPLHHTLGFLNPVTNEARSMREIPEIGAKQYGAFLLLRRNLNTGEKTKEAQKEMEETGKTDNSPSEASLARNVRFELHSVINDKLVWSREFPKEAPRFFFDAFSGRLILYWTLGTDVAKDRLNGNSELAARAKELGNMDDDYLMEVVDAFVGKTVGTLVLETGKRSFFIRSGRSEGNWLVLQDSENRVLVYSLTDGSLHHRFFGAGAAVNPARNQIVVQNYPGELTFYDLEHGDSQARLNFGSAAVFVRFSLDGKKLFVLSGEQTAYAFDVEKLTANVVQATH